MSSSHCAATRTAYLVAEAGVLLARASIIIGVTGEARRQQERLSALVQVLFPPSAIADEVASLARDDLDHERAKIPR